MRASSAAMRRSGGYSADLRRRSTTLDIKPIEFIGAGKQVVVPLEWSGRGKGSGAEVAERQGETWVFTVRDGKIAVVTEYRLKAEALEAVGLRE